jgi:hypothetical protein
MAHAARGDEGIAAQDEDVLRTGPRALHEILIRLVLRAEDRAAQGAHPVCQQGYADCDGAAVNGCETELSSEQCGRCEGCPDGTQCNEELETCE